MTEPTVFCPQCKSEIKLTESLAAPLLESVRRDYEQRLSQKDAEISRREKRLNERAESIDKAKQNLDQEIEQKLRSERARIVAEEAQKAKLAIGTDLEQKASEIDHLQQIMQ
jgi:phosphoglycerate-specific signal transduction histidine kinase